MQECNNFKSFEMKFSSHSASSNKWHGEKYAWMIISPKIWQKYLQGQGLNFLKLLTVPTFDTCKIFEIQKIKLTLDIFKFVKQIPSIILSFWIPKINIS